MKSISIVFALILFCLSLCSYASDSLGKSYRIYSIDGHLIQEKKSQNLQSDFSYYIETENGLYKKIHLNDSEIIDKHIFTLERIKVMSLEKIRLATSDVPENTVFDALSLLIEVTQSWESLDFHRSFSGYTLVQNILYNDYDMGNFLWGYSAAKLGVPHQTALMSAHLNGRFIDSHKLWDSEADQRAISNGYKYFLKNMTPAQKRLRLLDYIVL